MMKLGPFRKGECQCNPVPLARSGKQATYFDPCGVLRCIGCQKPVHLEDTGDVYLYGDWGTEV